MEMLKAYQMLSKKHHLPEMQPGGIKVQSRVFRDPEALWAELQSLQPSQGWLMFQSYQMPFHDGLPESQPDWGCLHSCEAVTEQGDSLAVLPDGQGGWRLIEYIPDDDAPGLWDEVRQFAHAPDSGMLCYRRYWVNEQGQGYVQKHACFIGFE